VFAKRHIGEFDDRTHDSICVCASVNELQEITGMVIWHFKKVNALIGVQRYTMQLLL